MNIGNKAKHLQLLTEAGFVVPRFFVIPPSYASRPNDIAGFLKGKLSPSKRYAVRSSGTLEDLPGFSFAGQYYTALNVKGVQNVAKEATRCFASVNSPTVQAYLKRHTIDSNDLQLAVIVQEMIQADISGVAFSVNPLSGNDKEIVINSAKGLGEVVVSGHVTPDYDAYNWYDDAFTARGTLMNDTVLTRLCKTVLDVQTYFGYPCDVEFAIKNDHIYLLQSRAITKIQYTGIDGEWTTADFRDGGVSSTVCTPYMWSLYEYIWERSYRDFLHHDMLLPASSLGKLGTMYYGRPYWSVSAAKKAMAQAPGYKEREFDNDLGITPTYEGDGVVTRLTPRTALSALRIYLNNQRAVASRLAHNDEKKRQLLEVYRQRILSVNDTAETWKHVVFDDYLAAESYYFTQIFTNTVAQALYKDSLTKHISQADYLKLLMGLDDISHLRPYQAIWQMSRRPTLSNKDLAQFLAEFGYHSTRELDITYPHFAEEPSIIRKMVNDARKLPVEHDPTLDITLQQTLFNDALARVPKRLHRTVLRLRKLLWWREEFRDISTRYYYLVRQYTLALAERLVREKTLEKVEDIWFLSIEDVKNYCEGTIQEKELRAIIRRNARYYQSFRHYTPPGEISSRVSTNKQLNDDQQTDSLLQGIGCSSGSVTGTARVVHDLAEIDCLEPNDILVTKFTDTGWTSKFAMISGVVTEYGGVLCHAAIVSREYGIPCVVCATGCLEYIKSGDRITINGETGEIIRKPS